MHQSNSTSDSNAALSWARSDIEQMLYFPGSKYTQVNSFLSAMLGFLLSVLFYCALLPIQGTQFADMFQKQGTIPYFIVFFSMWSLSILFIKSRKLALQKKCLRFDVVPEDVDFVLTSANVDTVLDRIYEVVDEPRQFLLFNRVYVALANLRNLGRVGDVDEILRSQAETDESTVETSYNLLNAFIWAIPVLGFIGTVLGLSAAIGGFGATLENTDEIELLKAGLTEVTGNLSLAFVTTLEALVAALAIQLVLTFVKKSEHEFLDQCSTYCTEHIVNRLRIMPFERGNQE